MDNSYCEQHEHILRLGGHVYMPIFALVVYMHRTVDCKCGLFYLYKGGLLFVCVLSVLCYAIFCFPGCELFIFFIKKGCLKVVSIGLFG